MAKRLRRPKGDGSIFFSESEDLWVGSITVDGKLRRKRSKRQKVVREWLDIQRQVIREGLAVTDERITVAQFLDKYMEDVGKHTLRPKTIENYSTLIRLHITPEIGSVRLSQLKPIHLQGLYSRKLESGLSRRTVELIHSIIHKTLDTALKWGLVVRNVADSVTAPHPEKKTIEPLTVAQAKRLVEAMEGDRLKALWLVAIGTGLRRGELLGLHKDNVYLDRGMIEVKYNLVEVVGQGLILGEPKSEASRRVVALPDFALEALRGHMEADQVASEFVFHTRSGKPISPRNASKYFKALLIKAELPEKLSLHTCRHTTISWLLAKGVPMKDVQMIAGHSQFSTTADIYGHAMPGYQKDAMKKLDGLL